MNPKQLYGDKKIPLHRVPPALLIFAAMGLADGARKYGPFNWRETKIETVTYYAATLRHLTAWFDGEDLDPDSGNPHLAHAIASLAILVDALTNEMIIETRPAAGAGPKLMGQFAERALPPQSLCDQGAAAVLQAQWPLPPQPSGMALLYPAQRAQKLQE